MGSVEIARTMPAKDEQWFFLGRFCDTPYFKGKNTSKINELLKGRLENGGFFQNCEK